MVIRRPGAGHSPLRKIALRVSKEVPRKVSQKVSGSTQREIHADEFAKGWAQPGVHADEFASGLPQGWGTRCDAQVSMPRFGQARGTRRGL